MDYEREVIAWVNKHNTPTDLRWTITLAYASINSLTQINGIKDDYELAVWRARLPLLRTKALLMGLTLPEFTDVQTP